MVLRLAASLERGSEHPLATALVRGAEDKNIEVLPVEGFEAIAGKGINGVVDGKRVALGNAQMIADLGLDLGLNTGTLKETAAARPGSR